LFLESRPADKYIARFAFGVRRIDVLPNTAIGKRHRLLERVTRQRIGELDSSTLGITAIWRFLAQSGPRMLELREYLGGAYHRLDCQLTQEGRRPWHLSESEVYAFKLRDDAATAEMLSMRSLYEEKSQPSGIFRSRQTNINHEFIQPEGFTWKGHPSKPSRMSAQCGKARTFAGRSLQH
jgi:hypothetical protein